MIGASVKQRKQRDDASNRKNQGHFKAWERVILETSHEISSKDESNEYEKTPRTNKQKGLKQYEVLQGNVSILGIEAIQTVESRQKSHEKTRNPGICKWDKINDAKSNGQSYRWYKQGTEATWF